MNSLEKMRRFKAALLETGENFDGVLGMVQGAAAAEQMGAPDMLAGLGDDPAELDATLLDIAAFCLWLRSDEAEAPDVEQLTTQAPAAIGELVAQAGLA